MPEILAGVGKGIYMRVHRIVYAMCIVFIATAGVRIVHAGNSVSCARLKAECKIDCKLGLGYLDEEFEIEPCSNGCDYFYDICYQNIGNKWHRHSKEAGEAANYGIERCNAKYHPNSDGKSRQSREFSACERACVGSASSANVHCGNECSIIP
jgi:hypothetical protein